MNLNVNKTFLFSGEVQLEAIALDRKLNRWARVLEHKETGSQGNNAISLNFHLLKPAHNDKEVQEIPSTILGRLKQDNFMIESKNHGFFKLFKK